MSDEDAAATAADAIIAGIKARGRGRTGGLSLTGGAPSNPQPAGSPLSWT